MNFVRRLSPRPAAWQRWLALGSVLLVFALGVFGANAELHAALHDDEAPAAEVHEHGCAVVLFATGTDLPVECLLVLQPLAPVTAERVAARESGYAEPHYRLPPGQAPPQV